MNVNWDLHNKWRRAVKFGRLLLVAISFFALVTLSSSEANAQGSWGGSRGGFASGGSWGSSGGLMGGRAPIRNLLDRLGSRFSQLGSGSSGGFLASRGGSLGSRFGSSTGFASSGGYASSGSFSSLGGFSSRGGYSSTGTSYGSNGGWGSTGSYANVSYGSAGFSTPILNTQPISTVATGYSNYSAESSYPVGDYGLASGYPVEVYNQPGSLSSPIMDGGSIDSMLEGYVDPNIPIEGGIVTPSGNGYYNEGESNPSGIQLDTNPVEPPGPEGDDSGSTSVRKPPVDYAILKLKVPVDTKILINDKPTSTTGSLRKYVSKGLEADRDYKYRVTAILERAGKELKESRIISLRPGLDQLVEINFEQPMVTKLDMRVPIDAKVMLCGKEMAKTGTNKRIFATTSLSKSEIWKDYQIEVEYERDGKLVRESRTLDIAGGKTYTVALGTSGGVDTLRVVSK